MKKRTLALILAALLALTAFVAVPAGADDVITSGDWRYTVNEDGATATITKYTGSETDVTIPREIDGHSVTEIGFEAFYECTSLTNVTIPDSVTTIDEDAFRDCTSLTSVTIPDGVTEIGFEAFYHCTSLETVYYGGSEEQWNTIEIGRYNGQLKNAKIIFAEESPTPAPGDLTGDGKINSRDVIALMKLVLTPNAEVTASNDLNNDGKVNSRDVILLMKLVLTQAK